MTTLTLVRAVPPDRADLAIELERFEAQFTYPLGPGRSFRISHGPDYPRFFRAIGDAACFVASRDGTVLGTLCGAATTLHTPDGSALAAVYLGDLKVAPEARGGRVLVELAKAMKHWVRGRPAFAVVMDGTRATPERYTGRLGIPLFREVGKGVALRLATATGMTFDPGWLTNEERGRECFDRLAAGRFHTNGGQPAERSAVEPIWLAAPDGSACGRVEDTVLAKRLISDDGSEMRSAHLSCFGYANPEAGAALLRQALGVSAMWQCASRYAGSPDGHAERLPSEPAAWALFVAVPAVEAGEFRALLPDVPTTVAPATVYATGLDPGHTWSINTAEV